MRYLRTIHQVQLEMTLDAKFEGAQYIITKSNINDTVWWYKRLNQSTSAIRGVQLESNMQG